MGQDDISLVSTTDSPEDVTAALTGKPAEKPAEGDKSPASAAAPKADDKAPPAADAKVDDKPAVPETIEQRDQRLENERKSARERRQAKIQSEIDTLTAKKHQTRREADQAEADLAELNRRKAQVESEIAGKKPAAAQPQQTHVIDVSDDPSVIAAQAVIAALGPEPVLEDASGTSQFKNYEEYVSAVGKWNRAVASAQSKLDVAEATARTKKELTAVDRARIEHATATRAHNEVVAQYEAKADDFKKATPDFDVVLESSKEFVDELVDNFGPDVLVTVDGFTTQDAEHGPAINYYLATHPEELRQIVALPPRRQLAALARLDERLGAASPSTARPPATSVTKAPEPMKPVGGSPTPSTVSPEDEDYRTYADRRNKEERERTAAAR